MPTIEQSPSPNFSDKHGRPNIAIVNHTTSGDFPGCLEWMQNPASQASAQYLVTRTGRIIQMVSEYKKAFANGIVNKPNWNLYDGTNPNLYTISIEHEGYDGSLTEEQYTSSLWLHREIIRDWSIPIDADHIIGHYRIDSVDRPNCPGPNFPWDRLFSDLKKGGEDMKFKVAILLNTKDDFWAGADVAARNGNCAIFVRPANVETEELIVVGGATTGHANETLLSGKDKYDTAAAVKKYLG